MAKVNVLVLTGYGLNCDYETAHAFEQAGLVQPREFEGRQVLFVDGSNLDLGGIRHERPHHDAGAVG